MLRILHCVNIMDRAGLETMLMNYYRNIDRSIVQFDFLTHRSEKGAYDNEIKKMGGRIFQAPRLYPKNYISYFAFMKLFFQEHPEYKIVHSHIDTMSAFPLFAAKKSHVPIRIGHCHSSKLDIDVKLPIKYLAKLLLPFEANVYAACGKKAAKFMFGNRPTKILHNAIEIGQFEFNQNIRNAIRNYLGLSDNFVIGHVGRYYYVKNQSFLIDIFKIVKQIVPNAFLLLVGKGEDEQKLKRKVSLLNLENSVDFLVDRDDVNELYQAMDVFVMPSLFEGLPLVGVEAQANGLPCLFSDSISDEILLTNNAEKMSLNRSPSEWANKIVSMKRSEMLQKNNYRLIEEGFDISREVIELTSWYFYLLKEIQV